MNKRNLFYYFIILAAFFLPNFNLLAQKGSVGIGTLAPDKSAVLELSSNTGGLLIPRMSLSQKNQIINPATGLLVFQTDFLSGFYYFDGNTWQVLTNTQNAIAADANWLTTGNTGLSALNNFIGTLDATPLSFKINNERSGFLDPTKGNTFFGYRAGILANSLNSIAIGAMAMQRATVGINNVAIGFQSMFNSQTGDDNVALGSSTFVTNISGQRNTIVGAQAGYRATGTGNIFLGYQAGYFEEGNNKLYIHNNSSLKPLIYGDFTRKNIGINTSVPQTALAIDSDTLHVSGLQLLKLTSASPTQTSNGKVLSVDGLGKVILVNDLNSGGGTTTTVVNSDVWKTQSNDIINQNAGNVKVSNSLIVNSIVDAAGLQVGASNITFKQLNANSIAATNATGKVLSLDAFGRVIVVKDSIGSGSTVINNTASGTNYWSADASNNISNTNSGLVNIKKLYISQDLNTWFTSIDGGGLQFKKVNANSNVGDSNGKVLTLDADGMVILTKAPNGSGGSVNAFWQQNGDRIEPLNNAKVVIGTGMNSYPNGYRLYVKEGILTERLRVAIANSNKWADYVFAQKYPLMPLSKVEQFIKEHKHLPNMYSADEMVKQGMDVSEISAKLLEKIEELTLYIIKADKQISVLQNKVEKLEVQLKEK